MRSCCEGAAQALRADADHGPRWGEWLTPLIDSGDLSQAARRLFPFLMADVECPLF